MSRIFHLLSLVLTMLCSAMLHAAPGDLDTTFGGGGGWVSTGFMRSVSNDSANDVILQADGKLVVAGSSNNGTEDFVLVRYNADGSLDTTFDGDGKVITAVGAARDEASSLIQQADGKLVAAGVSGSEFALARYNSDGSLDTTFSGDGKLTTTFGAGASGISVVIQTDGRLVVAGSHHNGTDWDFALVRYNSDGSLDKTFSGDGKLTTAVGLGSDYANSIIQQADGKLVVTGSSQNGTSQSGGLNRPGFSRHPRALQS